MDLPLWYQVKNHKLGFKDFLLLTLNNTKTNETDQTKYSIFFLSCLFNHHKYIDSLHLIQTILNSRKNNTHQLSLVMCLYLYHLFYGPYTNEAAFEFDSHKITKHTITVQDHFNISLLTQWIHLLLTSFFDIGVLSFDFSDKEITKITKCLEYNKFLTDHNIEVKNKTVTKFYNLQKQHENLVALVSFFRGEVFPEFLLPYRKNTEFFKSVVRNYWPKVLYTLSMNSEFTEDEIVIIRNSHKELHLHGNIEFLFDYIEEFSKIFGPKHELSLELQKFILPDPQNDALYAHNYLILLSEKERQKYFYQNLPISNSQLVRLTDEIRENGFEKVFTKYISRYITRYKEDLEYQSYNLFNDTFFLNPDSIFLYESSQWNIYIEEPIPNVEKINIYIFLNDELEYLKEKQVNPYTNKKFKDFPYPEMKSLTKSCSILSLWENILRRKIEFILN